MLDKSISLGVIPRARYTDKEFYRAEIRDVFKIQWLMVSHASELPEVGSYIQLDLPFAPVFLVRGKDGVIRAF